MLIFFKHTLISIYEELLEEKEKQRITHIIESNSPTTKAPCLTNTNTHTNTHTKNKHIKKSHYLIKY